ncbi:MAG: DMT family transporter [Lachnospiraceae bacterium]|nr:DMT family transporter [Lachnospiraceae bacterium]
MNQNKSKVKGIMYILMAGFSFACMSLFIKLAGDVPTFEKSFFRNLVAIFFAAGVMIKNHIPFEIGARSNLKYLLARSIAGTVGVFGNFYAVDHLVIADANMLNKLSPFFAIIFSFFLLKEKIKPYQLICVVTAFCGMLFIVKPGMQGLNSFGALLGLIGGAAAGLAYTNLRLASLNGVKGPVIVLFFSVFSCLASIPFMLPVYVHLSGYQLFCLLMCGLSATAGQFSITAAYSHAPAREISVYDYSQIIFAAVLGMIFLGELPDMLSIAGYIIITGAGVFMFLRGQKEE